MIANFLPNITFTIAEKFLIERLLELFFPRTLDSHRARLNNSKWILIELFQVLSDYHHGKIKAFDKTVKPLILETIKLIDDNILDFKSVKIGYYKKLLGDAKDNDYSQLSYATKLLIDTNQKYRDQILEKIEEELMQLNSRQILPKELDKLNSYADSLATELINIGFSKGYLCTVISKIFGDKRNIKFNEALNEFKEVISRTQEEFTVIFKLNKLGGGNRKIDIKSEFELPEENIKEFSDINLKSTAFFSKHGSFCYFLAIKLEGLDYLSVIEKAKRKVFTLIDLIHMGYPDNPFDFNKTCLVVGTRKRELANIQPVFYIPDGSYKNNEQLYDLLLEKMKRLFTNANIQKETKQKVVSALRHLRLGRDADELEQKFLNYWIGLEYIFSNYDMNDTTIVRLKKYFIYSHSISYIKRNLKEFHNDINRLRLHRSIPQLDENLDYLQDVKTYDFIIDNFSEAFPLLAYRADKYKRLISDQKILLQEINKHKNNLEWHLTRCYRIRNEIVHDAAFHLNIESITGNLKYYLTFILNDLMEYLDTAPHDINMDGQITINDYFILQELKYNSLSYGNFSLSDLMAERSATEIFFGSVKQAEPMSVSNISMSNSES